jgi:hypothetical protein
MGTKPKPLPEAPLRPGQSWRVHVTEYWEKGNTESGAKAFLLIPIGEYGRQPKTGDILRPDN